MRLRSQADAKRECWVPAESKGPAGPGPWCSALGLGGVPPVHRAHPAAPGAQEVTEGWSSPQLPGVSWGSCSCPGTVRTPRPALHPEGPRLSGTQQGQSEENGASTDPWLDCKDQLWARQGSFSSRTSVGCSAIVTFVQLVTLPVTRENAGYVIFVSRGGGGGRGDTVVLHTSVLSLQAPTVGAQAGLGHSQHKQHVGFLLGEMRNSKGSSKEKVKDGHCCP